MPAAVAEASAKADRSEQMWKTLKAHILRERARKKQEREAEVEEERLRKEREAREQQDVMTLGETREQISQLESKLTQFKEEKHQLFLQLKKVLNEDDNRRRQLVKENNDMIAIQAMNPAMVHQQLYIAPAVPQQQPPRTTAQIPQMQTFFKPNVKRPRSPSPPPVVPASMYHQEYGYKPPVPPPNVGTSVYQSPQKDQAARSEYLSLYRRRLQYGSQPGGFYAVAPQDISNYYLTMPPQGREPAKNMYDQPPPPPPRPQAFHMEQKMPDHYTLRSPVSHGHVIHAGAIPINAAPPPKSGSITAGYPVRQTQYQAPPPSAPPAALYTTQGRAIYQSPGALSYAPRD